MQNHAAHRHAVLVVDDYAPLQEASVLLLEAAGYAVTRADSGPEALATLRGGFRPCVMLLDAYMPEMDGAEVLAQMADDAALVDIAVVMVSGANDVVIAAHDGRRGMLAKPVEPDAMLAAVERYARCASRRDDVHARMQIMRDEAASAVASSDAMARSGRA